MIDISTYWYDDRKARANGKFDVALEFAIKEAEKIMAIGSFKARKIGFISIEGFDFVSDDFALIDGDMLYRH